MVGPTYWQHLLLAAGVLDEHVGPRRAFLYAYVDYL